MMDHGHALDDQTLAVEPSPAGFLSLALQRVIVLLE